MPEHQIKINQPSTTVLHSDISFTVTSDGATLGHLTISKGSIDWTPARHRTARSYTWEQFADLMAEAD